MTSKVTPEMLRNAQLYSELGAYVCSNMSGAYELIEELYSVMRSLEPNDLETGEANQLGGDDAS